MIWLYLLHDEIWTAILLFRLIILTFTFILHQAKDIYHLANNILHSSKEGGDIPASNIRSSSFPNMYTLTSKHGDFPKGRLSLSQKRLCTPTPKLLDENMLIKNENLRVNEGIKEEVQKSEAASPKGRGSESGYKREELNAEKLKNDEELIILATNGLLKETASTEKETTNEKHGESILQADYLEILADIEETENFNHNKSFTNLNQHTSSSFTSTPLESLAFGEHLRSTISSTEDLDKSLDDDSGEMDIESSGNETTFPLTDALHCGKRISEQGVLNPIIHTLSSDSKISPALPQYIDPLSLHSTQNIHRIQIPSINEEHSIKTETTGEVMVLQDNCLTSKNNKLNLSCDHICIEGGDALNILPKTNECLKTQFKTEIIKEASKNLLYDDSEISTFEFRFSEDGNKNLLKSDMLQNGMEEGKSNLERKDDFNSSKSNESKTNTPCLQTSTKNIKEDFHKAEKTEADLKNKRKKKNGKKGKSNKGSIECVENNETKLIPVEKEKAKFSETSKELNGASKGKVKSDCFSMQAMLPDILQGIKDDSDVSVGQILNTKDLPFDKFIKEVDPDNVSGAEEEEKESISNTWEAKLQYIDVSDGKQKEQKPKTDAKFKEKSYCTNTLEKRDNTTDSSDAFIGRIRSIKNCSLRALKDIAQYSDENISRFQCKPENPNPSKEVLKNVNIFRNTKSMDDSKPETYTNVKFGNKLKSSKKSEICVHYIDGYEEIDSKGKPTRKVQSKNECHVLENSADVSKHSGSHANNSEDITNSTDEPKRILNYGNTLENISEQDVTRSSFHRVKDSTENIHGVEEFQGNSTSLEDYENQSSQAHETKSTFLQGISNCAANQGGTDFKLQENVNVTRKEKGINDETNVNFEYYYWEEINEKIIKTDEKWITVTYARKKRVQQYAKNESSVMENMTTQQHLRCDVRLSDPINVANKEKRKSRNRKKKTRKSRQEFTEQNMGAIIELRESEITKKVPESKETAGTTEFTEPTKQSQHNGFAIEMTQENRKDVILENPPKNEVLNYSQALQKTNLKPSIPTENAELRLNHNKNNKPIHFQNDENSKSNSKSETIQRKIFSETKTPDENSVVNNLEISKPKDLKNIHSKSDSQSETMQEIIPATKQQKENSFENSKPKDVKNEVNSKNNSHSEAIQKTFLEMKQPKENLFVKNVSDLNQSKSLQQKGTVIQTKRINNDEGLLDTQVTDNVEISEKEIKPLRIESSILQLQMETNTPDTLQFSENLILENELAQPVTTSSKESVVSAICENWDTSTSSTQNEEMEYSEYMSTEECPRREKSLIHQENLSKSDRWTKELNAFSVEGRSTNISKQPVSMDFRTAKNALCSDSSKRKNWSKTSSFESYVSECSDERETPLSDDYVSEKSWKPCKAFSHKTYESKKFDDVQNNSQKQPRSNPAEMTSNQHRKPIINSSRPDQNINMNKKYENVKMKTSYHQQTSSSKDIQQNKNENTKHTKFKDIGLLPKSNMGNRSNIPQNTKNSYRVNRCQQRKGDGYQDIISNIEPNIQGINYRHETEMLQHCHEDDFHSPSANLQAYPGIRSHYHPTNNLHTNYQGITAKPWHSYYRSAGEYSRIYTTEPYHSRSNNPGTFCQNSRYHSSSENMPQFPHGPIGVISYQKNPYSVVEYQYVPIDSPLYQPAHVPPTQYPYGLMSPIEYQYFHPESMYAFVNEQQYQNPPIHPEQYQDVPLDRMQHLRTPINADHP